MLAGLPQNSTLYNPLETPDAAKNRQGIVLGLMAKHGFITEDEAGNAHREKLSYAAIPFPIKAPHFVMFVRGELQRRFGLEAIYKQGLQVHTTLDLDMQNTARRVARYRLAELAEIRDGMPSRNVRNAAVLVMDPTTGQILTMLGSPNYFDPQIDGAVNATMATRQPGSSIKPITYAAAFDPDIAAAGGYPPLTPASMMVDVRTAFVTKEGNPYVPENYDRVWRGPVLMRQSLASSYNLIAVKVLEYVGIDTMIDLARNMGIITFDNKDFGLALTLGGGEVRLVELTAAYAALANGGQKIEPVAITRITDYKGTLIYELPADTNPGPQVLDERTAYLITDILSDNYARRSTFGAGSPLRLSRPAAAKTGTTQDWRDNWTVGYTPDLVVGVWAGNADNEPMRHVSGVTGAAPIWHDIMEALHKTRPVREFVQPEGLTEQIVCAVNGLIPAADDEVSGVRYQVSGEESLDNNSQFTIHNSQFSVPCPHTITEIFVEGTQPQQIDTWHQRIALDRRNGLRAGPDCPLDFVKFQTFTLYPSEARNWARKQNVPEPPEIYSALCPLHLDGELVDDPITTGDPHPSSFPTHPLVFTSPDQGSIFRLSPNLPADKQKVRVGVRPADGVQIAGISLLVNGRKLSESTEFLWQMEPGTHTFEAVGVDEAGNELRANVVTIEVVE
jgi:membrane peptidoglycan carboxypeptidase